VAHIEGWDVLAGLFSERLAACKKVWDYAGPNRLLAFAQAIELCRIYRRPPEEWIADAAFDAVGERMTLQEKHRHRENMNHYARWGVVTKLKESGMTWDDSYGAATELLEDTEARGSEGTIIASYKFVQKEFREGRDSRFLMSDPQALAIKRD